MLHKSHVCAKKQTLNDDQEKGTDPTDPTTLIAQVSIDVHDNEYWFCIYIFFAFLRHHLMSLFLIAVFLSLAVLRQLFESFEILGKTCRGVKQKRQFWLCSVLLLIPKQQYTKTNLIFGNLDLLM
jgi:hypothetical protein